MLCSYHTADTQFISLHICHINMFQTEAVDRNYLYILCHINVYDEQVCKVL